MKDQLIVSKKGEPTEKGNVVLTVNFKRGLVKQQLLMMTEAADVKDIKVGDDITSQIPTSFKVRESEFVGDDGAVVKNKWIELV
jgi:hypothetical protein